MKLKALLTPIFLILSVVMIIWWIYPGYQDLETKKTDLASAKSRLADIQEKNTRAEALVGVWNSSADQRSIVAKYIPEQQQEEEIINNLNLLVSASGLSLYNLAISPAEKNKPVSGAISNIDNSNETGATGMAPSIEKISAAVGVTGDYGKIKTLIGKLDSFSRFNEITSLKIGKADNGPAGALKADIVLIFNYMEKNNSVVNLNNKLFASGGFDMDTINAIAKKLTINAESVVVGSAGRENPFVK